MTIPAPMHANGTKAHEPGTPSSSDVLKNRGDLLIRSFSEGSTDTIIDARVTNLDSKSYRTLPPKKALERQKKEKKKKHCKPPFHTFRGVNGRIVRIQSPSISQEACKVARRRMGELMLE